MLNNKFLKFLDSVFLGINYISLVLFATLVILLFLESIVRKLFGNSIIVVDEIGGIGMYLIIMLNISVLYKNADHLNSDLLVGRLSTKSRYILELFTHIMTLIFSCLVTYLWCRFLFLTTFETRKYFPMLGIIEWPFHIIGMMGWGMLFFAAICRFSETIKKGFLEK